MIDTSGYPAHVQDAIQKMNLAANALERAKCGASMLDSIAPRGWRLEMISIHDGIVSSHVHMVYDDQNPLALAFRRDPELKQKGPGGRVTWAVVANEHFPSVGMGTSQMQHYGFLEKQHVVGDVVISSDIDAAFLDDAWTKILCELEWEHQPVASYNKAA